MKKVILFLVLIFCFQILNVKEVWAIKCSVQYTSSSFSKTEARISISDITNVLFQAEVSFIEETSKRKNERCHFGLDVTVLPGTLVATINYGDKSYAGGSNKIGITGLREAIVRAFYQEELFRRKMCKFFGKTYNLNCIAFEE